MKNYRGRIVFLEERPMSTLWHLIVHPLDLESPSLVLIDCADGVRTLAEAFGAIEHSGNLGRKIGGQEIVFQIGTFCGHCGVLLAFTPAADWDKAEDQRGEHSFIIDHGPDHGTDFLSDEDVEEIDRKYDARN